MDPKQQMVSNIGISFSRSLLSSVILVFGGVYNFKKLAYLQLTQRELSQSLSNLQDGPPIMTSDNYPCKRVTGVITGYM